jgi:hypothetical protein
MHSIRFLLQHRKINDYLCRKACFVELLIVGESVRAGKRLRDKFVRVLHGNAVIELSNSNQLEKFASAFLSWAE